MFVARLDLWRTLSTLAEIASGAPVPDAKELPTAPGWTFIGETGWHKLELGHPLAGLSFEITPMML